jgi:antitoxin component YwqK of YwqJK toxin-antitoxin module
MKGKIEVKQSYYPKGSLRAERSFKDGVPHGRHREWHENGVLAFEGFLKDGVPDGVANQWNEQGELVCTYEIKNGTGIQKTWFASQGIWGEISWVNGMMTGRHRTFWEDGTVAGDTFWIRNRRVS